MEFIFYIFVFLFGLIIGSFLNVVIFRLETGEGIVKKRSHCPKCGHVLRWYDLIPVLSFIFLRGKCRDCHRPISWQYLLVELATGLLFLLIYQFLNFQISLASPTGGQFLSLIFWFFIVSCLIVIFAYDLRHYIIPDKIIYPAIIVSLIFRLFEICLPAVALAKAGDLFGIWWPFIVYILSAIGAGAFFLAIVLLTRGRGMGIGDVKLAFLMGLLLGWPGILIALMLAFFVGALVGVILILAKRKGWKSQIPFGPFLVGATIFTLFFGKIISDLYFNLLI